MDCGCLRARVRERERSGRCGEHYMCMGSLCDACACVYETLHSISEQRRTMNFNVSSAKYKRSCTHAEEDAAPGVETSASSCKKSSRSSGVRVCSISHHTDGSTPKSWLRSRCSRSNASSGGAVAVPGLNMTSSVSSCGSGWRKRC